MFGGSAVGIVLVLIALVLLVVVAVDIEDVIVVADEADGSGNDGVDGAGTCGVGTTEEVSNSARHSGYVATCMKYATKELATWLLDSC